jgi:hypothetical protein
MNYYEELSLLNENSSFEKNNKIQLIKSVFGDEIDNIKLEKLLFIFTDKIN